MDRTRCQVESSLALRCVPKAKYLLVLQRCQQSEILGKVPSNGAQRLPLFLYCAVLCLVSQMCLAPSDSVDCSPPGSSSHGDSPGQNTGVGCHALLQRIFPTQGSNPGLPHCRQILYHLSHQGNIIIIGLL